MSAPELRATARLQLHREFDLRAAAAQVPYYAALGISHLYLSPIGAACAGSTHGYDVIDPRVVNPELGGESALRELTATLHQHAMGCIVDIVPNHMATDTSNPWWHDVLASGLESPYARYFDIDWHAPEADGRIWLAVLPAPLASMLAQGKLGLALDPEHGRLGLDSAGLWLPLSLRSLRHALMLAGIDVPRHSSRDDLLTAVSQSLHAPATLASLRQADRYLRADPHAMQVLLGLQHYRLAWWRSGNDVLNYRRFFDISSLIALSIERAEVFDAVHALPLRLIAEGLIDGVRLDHVDGLSQPRAYLRKLRRVIDRAARRRPAGTTTPVSIHVEKILASDESLRRDWPVDGTTGYDFMDQVGALLHAPAGAEPLRQAWQAISGRAADFGVEERAARRSLLDGSLQAEHAAGVRAWHQHALRGAEGHDLTHHALNRALVDVLEWMPAYRSYLGPAGATPADQALLRQAFDAAARHGDPDRAELRDYLCRELLDTELRRLPAGPDRAALALARRRFEQTAAPLNAKAVEDTGFYRYGALLSRNEVGSDPRQFALSTAAFHHAMQQRAERWPRALLATATHDHKRGEDTRARLSVLSEHAPRFVTEATEWLEQLQRIEATPSAGDDWMLLQTILAAWPLGLQADDRAGLATFAQRLRDWQLKAIREAKLRTRWTAPDEAYEYACAALIERIFNDGANTSLRHALAQAAHRLDAPGALNGLVATTLRLTAPGVPDLYQGSERWDQSLVDPDNRRPVDYALRRAGPGDDADPQQLLADFRDGAIKQWLVARLLKLRRTKPALFAHGDYRPLALRGTRAENALAFIRTQGDERLLVVVPLRCADAVIDDRPQPRADYWGDTELVLGDEYTACTFTDVFSHGSVTVPPSTTLALANLLGRWPITVCHAQI